MCVHVRVASRVGVWVDRRTVCECALLRACFEICVCMCVSVFLSQLMQTKTERIVDTSKHVICRTCGGHKGGLFSVLLCLFFFFQRLFWRKHSQDKCCLHFRFFFHLKRQMEHEQQKHSFGWSYCLTDSTGYKKKTRLMAARSDCSHAVAIDAFELKLCRKVA